MKTSIHIITDPGANYRIARMLGKKECFVLRLENYSNEIREKLVDVGFINYDGFFSWFLPCESYEDARKKQTELNQ